MNYSPISDRDQYVKLSPNDMGLRDLIFKGRFAGTEKGEEIVAQQRKEQQSIKQIVRNNTKHGHYKTNNLKTKFDELPEHLQQLIQE